jgi:hypothetical protein
MQSHGISDPWKYECLPDKLVQESPRERKRKSIKFVLLFVKEIREILIVSLYFLYEFV